MLFKDRKIRSREEILSKARRDWPGFVGLAFGAFSLYFGMLTNLTWMSIGATILLLASVSYFAMRP